jgi:hypothetical protein
MPHCFFLRPLFQTDVKFSIEMNGIVRHIVMPCTQIHSQTVFFALTPQSCAEENMMPMQVSCCVAENALALVLQYTFHHVSPSTVI